MPASPAKVSGSAPIATPSRVISASPRVMSAARGLWPSPSPSRMPGGDGDHVLERAASSTPITSLPGVHPERRRREQLLRVARGRLVSRRGHHRRRLALAHLDGEAGPGERREPRAAAGTRANTCRHQRERVGLDALGGAHDRACPAPPLGAPAVDHGAHRVARRRRHDRRRRPPPPPGIARRRGAPSQSRTPGRNSGFSCVRLTASTTSAS